MKVAALDAGITVEQPESLKDDQVRAHLAAYQPDLMVVVAYGLILPRKVLAIPRLGCWNVHGSLLPRWRGAAPIQRAVLAGDEETGVDLMQMEAGLDTGPTLIRRATPITRDDTGGSVHDRLAALGAEALAEGLARVMGGETLTPTPQPDEGVTYAHKLDKAEALLDFKLPAIDLERKVRAFNPWPVAEADIAGERVRVWAGHALERGQSEHSDPKTSPGSVMAASRQGIDLATGQGMLRITSVQRAGGRPIAASDYLNARTELRTP